MGHTFSVFWGSFISSDMEIGIRTVTTTTTTLASKPYKAMVMLYLAGGADTFNMLVPLKDAAGSHCTLYDEYRAIRRDIATMSLDQLSEIQACSEAACPQPCHTLYDLTSCR